MGEPYERSLRVLQVMEVLARSTYPQTMSQLAQRTQLPKTSLMRMLNALQDLAYVARLPGRGAYVAGPRAHHLALSVLQAPPLMNACRSVLSKLVAVTAETCNLNALAGDAVQYLVRVEGPGALRLQLHMDIGAHVPLHCTASGKLFLAHTPRPFQGKILDRLMLDAMAPRTITDREKLETELRLIRDQDIGIDDEEFVPGMVAIAVPVRDAHGVMMAALACHAPTARASLNELLELAWPMRAAAEELSGILVSG